MSQWPSSKARRVFAALVRLGWELKRQSGSHRTLSREGWPDFVFAFHDGEELGPRMLARIAKHTGLQPKDLQRLIDRRTQHIEQVWRMPTSDSRSEYASRMHRVVETIDRQLDQARDLDTPAAVAHFSPFHFHRLFWVWMGETLGDYLRRRRLEVAAMWLAAQPRTTVLNIALSVGFGAPSANAIANFAMPPWWWRGAWPTRATQRRSGWAKMRCAN